jgi:putative colanic acid biosynthesis UDP-glucose lipid carrier transferase
VFDGIVSPTSSSAVRFDEAEPRWQPRWRRNAFCPALKRSMDVVLSAAVLLLLAPAYGLIALAIRLDSAGPILFRQKRTGRNGRIFTIYKFRTMRVQSADAAVRHATRDDDRITRIGRFLRETSLDEIPQLLNILRGDMSIVGPRPHAVEHDRHYGALLPHYNQRFAVRPGLTGLAQVQGLRGEIRDLSCMQRRVQVDILYARNWSFLGDVSIILRTIPLLLARVNAY